MFTKIKRILKFARKQIAFNRNREQERLEQKRDGYQIFLINGYGRTFVLYREGDKSLVLDTRMTLDNNAALSVKALEYWFEPKGEKLSDIELQRAKDRLVKFHSIWGEVIVDVAPVRTVNEIIADLNSRGIDFHNLEDT